MHSSLTVQCVQCLPPPAARSGGAASTALGEVGGAQHPKGASTDGWGQLRTGRDDLAVLAALAGG